MKKKYALILVLVILTALAFSACSSESDAGATETPQAPTPVVTPAVTPPVTEEPSETAEPSESEGSENAIEEVVLTNSADSTGNNAYFSAHYGLHAAYDGGYVNMMNYTKLLKHGKEIGSEPVIHEGFEYQAEDLRFYNDRLYFLLYDFEKGVYNLYAYDYENPPAKVTESTVYHYEFIGGKIYFTKEFVQGPLYSMNLDGSGETSLTQMRVHSMVTDGTAIYFYATDAGTAPGLVKYDISTGEETTVVFPFYSHNYMVHGGYVYYVTDATYRSIHRMNLSNQTVEDLWTEISDYTISLNMSDGMLYILSGYNIYRCNPDGSGRTLLFENDESLQSGMHIYGNRIYATDGYEIIVIDRDDGTGYEFPLD